jgi:hypothetical protein
VGPIECGHGTDTRLTISQTWHSNMIAQIFRHMPGMNVLDNSTQVGLGINCDIILCGPRQKYLLAIEFSLPPNRQFIDVSIDLDSQLKSCGARLTHLGIPIES